MGPLLEVCVVLVVTGSLVAVLAYGAFFVLAALQTTLRRRRPDPVALAVDELLVEVLGAPSVPTTRSRRHGARRRAIGARQ